jgi:hypothetical protein
MRSSLTAAAAFLLGAAVCFAQSTFEELNPLGAEPGGLRLSSATFFGGYSSLKSPNAAALPQGAVPLGADNTVGGTLVVHWSHTGPGQGVSLTYTPSYTGLLRNSKWSSMNHSLSFSANGKMSRKWTLGFSIDGQAASSNELLFTPAVMTRITAVNATFEDLAAALLSGSLTNTQLASILTATPIVETPSSVLLYGNRVLNMGASTSLTYSSSTRLSFHFTAGVARSQYLNDGQDPRSARNSAVLSGTSAGNAGFGLSYSVTPRTSFGLDGTATRSFSAFQDAYNVTARATLGRKVTNWLLLSIYGGGAKMFAVRTTTALPTGVQSVGGATLGIRRLAQSFTVTAGRSAADSYALGAGHTDSLSGAWQWRRPGSGWTLATSIGWQQLGGTPAISMDGWQATASLEHTLTHQVSVRTTYAYMDSSGSFLNVARDLRMHSVRLELVWQPSRMQ